ncbi:hypothetical protein MWH28_11270 [Natroniella sulfidigena]|uniref:hypothetical protein n=1 Tax=Natroniella sulfidigena TaxID=723921 RepID=UPI00200B20F8|nr:hypothetical protein [Natroniella sulfidigena]MCK8817937.1 hypothetical protein [Natroniella sulfidigena]
MLATFTLTVPESKRLIAKAVKELPEVKKALKSHKIIVAGGTTNGYVAEELTGKKLRKEYYTAGTINQGLSCVTDPEQRVKPLTLEAGQAGEEDWLDLLDSFGSQDVFIKGANAFDDQGVAGVLAAHPEGGTVGFSLGTLVARGAQLIIPVGLEKRIDSVQRASKMVGIEQVDYSLGMKAGLIPISSGKIITELEALEVLTGVKAEQIAAGGVGGSTGAVTLAVEGSEEEVKETLALIKGLKGEPALKDNKRICNSCDDQCNRVLNIE